MSSAGRVLLDCGLLLTLLLWMCTGTGCDPESPSEEPAVVAVPASPDREADADDTDPSEFDFMVGPNDGRWHRPRTHRFGANLSDQQRLEFERLAALGYLDGIHAAETPGGVSRHDPKAASAGLNLLTSAHAATAILLDMEGIALHQWSYEFAKVWPRRPLYKPTSFWRRTHLYENGDLLAIYDGHGIIKLDRDSKLLWRSAIGAHHDLAPLPDGSVWVLTREVHIVPQIHPEHPVLEDFITLLGPRGKERRRISLLEAMEGADFRHLWNGEPDDYGDLFHTNTLERLDGRFSDKNPAFAEGNLLVSMLLLDLIAVLDPRTEKIVWTMKGNFHQQHDPQLLESGNLMLFDNNPAAGASAVLELDPATGAERWAYRGSEEAPFYSETCGTSQRLPNGNTLITESDFGRAFEVTSNGEIVWEFINPYRAGNEQQFIATVMEMKRLPPDFPLNWLDAASRPSP